MLHWLSGKIAFSSSSESSTIQNHPHDYSDYLVLDIIKVIDVELRLTDVEIDIDSKHYKIIICDNMLIWSS